MESALIYKKNFIQFSTLKAEAPLINGPIHFFLSDYNTIYSDQRE